MTTQTNDAMVIVAYARKALREARIALDAYRNDPTEENYRRMMVTGNEADAAYATADAAYARLTV